MPIRASIRIAGVARIWLATMSAGGWLVLTAPADAAGCRLAPQGEGRVATVIDWRSFRLEDGREVLLDGIQTTRRDGAELARALTDLIDGRDVSLYGATDTPDRYGRQPALVFFSTDETSVQAKLLALGEEVASASIADPDCATALFAAEAEARAARRGIWSAPGAVLDAGKPDDILQIVGHFALVEGRVMSVREAGGTVYLNFGRRWTQDFAVTISRRIIAAFEGLGTNVKSLESKRIRVRGWISKRTGPRLEVTRVGQIERLGEN